MLNLREGNRRTRLGALAILTLGAISSLPTQASVVYLSRDSSISTVVCGTTCSSEEVTDTSFDSFSQSLGTAGVTGYASQQSQLTQSGISVSLQATQGADNYNEIASAAFSVTFSVSTQTSFQLTGNTSYLLLGGDSTITFSGPACSANTFPPCSSTTQSGDFVNSSISQTGTLQPGEYTLIADADANGEPYMGEPPNSVATAQLTLTPVPLPPGGVLLAVGLLSMLTRFGAAEARRLFAPRCAA